MTSKTSLLKGGVVRFQLKRFWWVAALYGLLLFLFVPFRLLSSEGDYLLRNIGAYPELRNNVMLGNPASFVLLIGAAVVLGICMLCYLQNTRSATLLHAMPVRRTELYLSSLAAGFILLAAPIFLNGVILFFMSLTGGYYRILPPVLIWDWIGSQLLTGTSVLCFTMCVGVLTGSLVGHGVFTFVLCFLPLGVTALMSMLLESWLFGFASEGITPVLLKMVQMTPMYAPQFLTDDPIWWIPVLAGIYILLFTGLGLLLYQKRDTERAGDVMAFSWLRPIFLYGVSFCVMLAGTWFVMQLGRESSVRPNVIVMLLFGLLGYAAAKILLLKSFRIAHYYKGFIAFAVVVLVLYSAVDFNLFGFGTTVPEAEKIEAGYIGYYYYTAWQSDKSYGSIDYAVFTDAENINAVRSLQREAISRQPKPAKRNSSQERVYFSYRLKSGRVITRRYTLEPELLFRLLSTDAAKDSMYPNLRQMPEKIKYMEFLNEEFYGAEKEELIGCIQRDLECLDYEEINMQYSRVQNAIADSADVSVYSMTVYCDNDNQKNTALKNGESIGIYFEFNDNFSETVEWLQARGLMQNASPVITAEID